MPKNKRTVLIVDDDLGMIKILEKWLTVAGYRVIPASKGELAVRRAAEEKPDIILLDVLMPEMNGHEVAKKLGENPETTDIPVIFITVCVDLENDKGFETIEVDGVQYRAFAKPLHNARLLSTMRKEINKRIHGNK